MLQIPGTDTASASSQVQGSAVSSNPITATGSPVSQSRAPHSPVDMKLWPDESQPQKVSSAVADAVNTEVNSNATDAIAAYGNALGELNAIGSSQLQTGDIIQWEHGSAIIACKGNDAYMIVNGDYKPLDPHSPPSGPYGSFQGFFRPDAAEIQGSERANENVQPAAAVTTGTPPAPGTTTRRV